MEATIHVNKEEACPPQSYHDVIQFPYLMIAALLIVETTSLHSPAPFVFRT